MAGIKKNVSVYSILALMRTAVKWNLFEL
jgi:hypothetical protein